MDAAAREGEHTGVSDVFDWHGNAVFPCSERFVVGGAHEPAAFVDEDQRVDGAEVVVVFLREFAGAGVELDDFLVGHAC